MKHNKVNSGSDLPFIGSDGLTVGQRLQKVMDSRKLTQQDIASLCGCTAGYIDGWQHDRRPIPSNYAVLICRTYDISVSWLLTGHSEKNVTVGKDLGLSEESIQNLLFATKNSDKTMFFTSSLPGETGNKKHGGDYLLILNTINFLLSSQEGKNLLHKLGLFLFSDFSSGRMIDNKGGLLWEDINKILFPVTGSRTDYSISPDLLSVAAQQEILSLLQTAKKALEPELQKIRNSAEKKVNELYNSGKKEFVQTLLTLIPQNTHNALWDTDHEVYSFLTNENNIEYVKTLEKELQEISELTKEMVEKETTEEMSLISELRKELNLGEEEQPPVDVLAERIKMSDERILRDQKLDDLAEKVRKYMKESV